MGHVQNCIKTFNLPSKVVFCDISVLLNKGL